LIGILLAAGCTLKGGGVLPSAAGTASPLTWESTAACPKTVAIIDTRTGETVFELDIPMGQQLSVQFYEHKDPQKHPEAPDLMKYTLQPLGRWVGHLTQSIEVPHAWNRRIDVFFRTPESYTPPDPTRPVVPFEVPLPDTKAKDASEPDATGTAAAQDTDAATPADDAAKDDDAAAAAPAPEHAGTDAPKPADDAASEDEPAKSPARDVPQPAASDEPAVPAARPAAPTASPASTGPPRAKPHATMTWTDTGTTRRVSVSDIQSGDRVFEIDVPAGHDLVLHFHTMWTPPGKSDDVEAMHWEIVPAGTSTKVPPHHATVPSGTHRRVSEQAVAPPPTPPAPPPAPQPEGAAAASPDAETKPTPDANSEPDPGAPAKTAPPPVNLIDDEDDAKPAPASPQH